MEHEVLAKKFKQEIKEVLKRDLSEDVLNRTFTSIKTRIDKDIKEGYFNSMCSTLAFGIGIHGGDYPKQLILNGDTEGWKYITRYLLWSQHIIEKRNKWFDVSNRNMGSILAFSQLWEMAELKPIIRAYFQEYYEEEKEKYKKKESHHLFVALVFDLLEDGSYEEAMFQFLPTGSVYQTFLENWNTTDDALYQKLIFDLCDAHIYSCLDVKNKMTEILSHDLIPYDIKLIEKLRTKQGLSAPKVAHPLLETALYDIPKEMIPWNLAEDEVYQYLLLKEEQYLK
ncbi:MULTISPECIES: hypothetical protein [unclassified Myroides]|uniref:hypothetical protein n=1 Tax=unclassified Myroides TaxID=2642485 RepID=UPI003D2F680A